jgi:hypothetical protein
MGANTNEYGITNTKQIKNTTIGHVAHLSLVANALYNRID